MEAKENRVVEIQKKAKLQARGLEEMTVYVTFLSACVGNSKVWLLEKMLSNN